MAYQSWSVVFGEQPSAAKWNILGSNDASFNDGSGIADGAITPAKRTGGFYIGQIAAATLGTTGNKAITGVGFTPKLVRFTVAPTSSSADINMGVGAMTSAAQYYMAGASSANAGSRNSSTTSCIGWVVSGSSSPSLLCSYVSMDADGFTINVGTASNSFPVSYECYG